MSAKETYNPPPPPYDHDPEDYSVTSPFRPPLIVTTSPPTTNIMTVSHAKPGVLLLVALLLGVVFNFLFYNQMPGLNLFLFVGLLLGSLLVLSRFEKVKPVITNLWLVLPIMFLAVMVAVRTGTIITVLNIVGMLFLLILLCYFYAADKLERLELWGYVVVPFQVIMLSMARSLQTVAQFRNTAKLGGYGRKATWAMPLLRGVLITVPVLIIFTVILSSADSIFQGYVNKAFDFQFLQDGSFVPRLLLISFISFLASGSLSYALVRPQLAAHKRSENLPGTLVPGKLLGFFETTMLLTLVNVLFGLFAIVQFTVLFSGQAERTMDYAAFREYVRRGFGELLFAASLVIALILVLRWTTRFTDMRQQLVFKGLCTIMVGLALVLVFAAFQRMITWERIQYFINTDIRIYVRSFVVWLALLFGWLLVVLWFKQPKFMLGLLLAGIGFMVTVNLLNPDADVAEYNLSRYSTGQNADLSYRYLSSLSTDAVPTMASYLDKSTGTVKTCLDYNLSVHLNRLERTRGQWDNWYTYNYSRAEAYQTLKRLKDSGKIVSDIKGYYSSNFCSSYF